jgi:hypothetical protein
MDLATELFTNLRVFGQIIFTRSYRNRPDKVYQAGTQFNGDIHRAAGAQAKAAWTKLALAFFCLLFNFTSLKVDKTIRLNLE